MHGFCTDFARFQNVQRVLFVAKSDKGCRNYRVKNHGALIKNYDKSKFPEIDTNRRLALLISGPRVRVPGGAPQQQNPNFFPIGEGFGFFVFFGKQNESLASIEKRSRPYPKRRAGLDSKAALRNQNGSAVLIVYRNSCRSGWLHHALCAGNRAFHRREHSFCPPAFLRDTGSSCIFP